MKALTLIQPWAWCITHAGKRVENRTWPPPAPLLGERFAIHAGVSRSGAETVDHLAEQGIVVTGPVHFGAIVATVQLVGVSRDLGPMTIADGCDARRILALAMTQWRMGPIGWVLDDVRVLSEPVPCRGAQGLWTLPADVERLVIEREVRS